MTQVNSALFPTARTTRDTIPIPDIISSSILNQKLKKHELILRSPDSGGDTDSTRCSHLSRYSHLKRVHFYAILSLLSRHCPNPIPIFFRWIIDKVIASSHVQAGSFIVFIEIKNIRKVIVR